MKGFLRKLLFVFILLASVAAIFNVNVTTRQGINGQHYTIRMPLYLKILDFFDRHYNYQQLVKRIIKDAKADKGRIIGIFEWTYRNIRGVPEGFPVIDDHVWHIIIRGYGTNDQSADVFATLCNYAGTEAFYSSVCSSDKKSKICLSFVKVNKRWTIFDPYNGVYFENQNGGFAGIGELKEGSYVFRSIGEPKRQPFTYQIFFNDLPMAKNSVLRRSNVQSPLRRLIYEIRRYI